MIHSVVSNTGPYAHLWSNLKSFEYSLERAESKNRNQITKLDEERLEALIEFFEDVVSTQSTISVTNLSSWSSQHKYTWAIDFRSIIKTALFDPNKPTENKFSDKKVRQLVKPIKEFLQEKNGELFSLEPQPLLKKTLKNLLTNTELSMYR